MVRDEDLDRLADYRDAMALEVSLARSVLRAYKTLDYYGRDQVPEGLRAELDRYLMKLASDGVTL